MTTTTQRGTAVAPARQMLNKVPEVTICFWIIKILATTVGETAADFLNTTIDLGLTGTTYVMGALLLFVLFFQFRATRYIPAIYWLAVVLISVVGTLITDDLTDNLGISTASRRGAGRRGTGWPSCSPSPSAPRAVTSPPSVSTSATGGRRSCSRRSSRSSPWRTAASG
jgi:hypothetical protein